MCPVQRLHGDYDMVFAMRATVCSAAAERIKADDVSIVHARDFVKSGSGTRLDPWVGADGAGGIRDAIASVPTGKVRVLCAAGFFEVSSVLKIRADAEVFGAGMNDTTLLHTPFTTYSSFGSLEAGCTLANLTLDGNRWAPTASDLCVGGIALQAPDISVRRVRAKNFACAAFSPSRHSDDLEITDCVSIDNHYFVWAEATCGYAGHRYLRNSIATTRSDAKNRSNAFELDNGNADGLLNCTAPATAAERHARRNIVAGNRITNFIWQGIAIARMHGFEVSDNLILAGELSLPGGNGIHVEHNSGDINISGNTVTQPQSEPIWIAASANVSVAHNTVAMANCSKDCVQVCTQPHRQAVPEGHADPLDTGIRIVGNTLSGCRSGVNVWGNGSAGLFGVAIEGNEIAKSWEAAVSVGSARGIAVRGNHISGAPVPVRVTVGAEQLAVEGNTFRGCASCEVEYVQPLAPRAQVANNTCVQ